MKKTTYPKKPTTKRDKHFFQQGRGMEFAINNNLADHNDAIESAEQVKNWNKAKFNLKWGNTVELLTKILIVSLAILFTIWISSIIIHPVPANLN